MPSRTVSRTRRTRPAVGRSRVIGQLALYLKLDRSSLIFEVAAQPNRSILWAGASIYSRYTARVVDNRLATGLPATGASGCSFVSADGSVVFACAGYSAVYSPRHMGHTSSEGPIWFFLKGSQERLLSTVQVRTLSLSVIGHLGDGPEIVKKIQRAVRQFNLERYEFFGATMKPLKVAARKGWVIAQ